jgi:hypothetical protein
MPLEQVSLTSKEFIHAAFAGFYRQVWAIENGLRDAHGFTGDPWRIHIVGALAEFACAKAFGLFWSGPGELRQIDVGGCLQVRRIERVDGEMTLYRGDRDDQVFVCMYGATPLEWTVCGWIYGRDGKRREWLRAKRQGGEAFFVPRHALNLTDPPMLADESERDERWRKRFW